jgi:hypothetical protein
MHRLNELAAKLTPIEVKEVEDFAEFLIARGGSRNKAVPSGGRIDVDALIGMFEGMGGDKSDKELIREAWDDVIAKYEE